MKIKIILLKILIDINYDVYILVILAIKNYVSAFKIL